METKYNEEFMLQDKYVIYCILFLTDREHQHIWYLLRKTHLAISTQCDVKQATMSRFYKVTVEK